MKPTALFLLLSLLGNAALLALLALRPGAANPASTTPSVTAPPPPAGTPAADGLRAALASGDAAALEAAGVPVEVARHLALGRAMSRYADIARRIRASTTGDGRWWRTGSSRTAMTREQRQQFWAAQRELADAVTAALGEDLGLFGSAGADPGLAFLPPTKRDALRRIEQDYAEMMAEFSGAGAQLASDREKLQLLREERRRDIAAVLSPSELIEYDLRTSPTALSLRARYGDAIASEEDFRKVYELQKAFDEKFPRDAFVGRIAPERLQKRAAAERQLQENLRAALGDEKYAALRRATDTDLRVVDSLASRLNLPATTADRVAAARENYAAESQRINRDTSLPPAQRRAEIQSLGTRAKTELSQVLGGEAADAYAQRSTWLNMLQSGMAFSTNPNDAPGGALTLAGGQTVFPIMPPGGGPGMGTRQIVNIVGGNAAPAVPGATFLAPTPGPVAGENTQVISVIRTEASHDTPPTPPASTATPAPPGAAPAPKGTGNP